MIFLDMPAGTSSPKAVFRMTVSVFFSGMFTLPTQMHSISAATRIMANSA